MLREKYIENIKIHWPAEKVVLLSYVNIRYDLAEGRIKNLIVQIAKSLNHGISLSYESSRP